MQIQAERFYLLGKVKLMEIVNKLKINNKMIFDNIQNSGESSLFI